MPEEKPGGSAEPRTSRWAVQWHSVSYRMLLLSSGLIITLVAAGGVLVLSGRTGRGLRELLHGTAGVESGSRAGSGRQAHFLNLEGKVQVKKVDSVQWIAAGYELGLDTGDLVQTGPESIARLAFAGGSTYTVKADTLITVEQNQGGEQGASRVGIQIRSGAVDLATGSWMNSGARAAIGFENAEAAVGANSRVAARTDPETHLSALAVTAGAADLVREGQHFTLSSWQEASFGATGDVKRTLVLAAPTPLQPQDLEPIIAPQPTQASIAFSWSPAQGANGYFLEVSNSALFSRILAQQRTTLPSASLTGMAAGDYFWVVRAIDAQGNAGPPSDAYRFTLVALASTQQMLLQVQPPTLHGNVAEISGRTEPGATLIINGQTVADLLPDGRFRYFTAPLPHGTQIIAITGQNRRGGTAIQRISVVIP